jgi:hypothetical protein
LLAGWLFFEWPNLDEQAGTTTRARAALAPLSPDERTAALDNPGYQTAQAIARATPAAACVLVLAHTGPEHLRYYQARFGYYLYPRRLRWSDRTDAPEEGCAYLAVFRDTSPNLAQEPFRGRWEETELKARTASKTKIASAARLEIFQ